MSIPDGWAYIKAKPPNQTGKKSLLNPETGETLFEHPSKAPDGFVIRVDYEKEQRKLRPVKNIWITNDVISRRISNKDSIPDGWRLGKTSKKSGKPRKPQTHSGPTKGKVAVNDGTKVIYINPDDVVPEGFSYGLGSTRNIKGTTGKRCYNNDKVNIMIPVDDPIPEGFVKGRLHINPQPDKSLTGMSNKFVVNNGIQNLVLTKGESIPDGFVLGKIKLKNDN